MDPWIWKNSVYHVWSHLNPWWMKGEGVADHWIGVYWHFFLHWNKSCSFSHVGNDDSFQKKQLRVLGGNKGVKWCNNGWLVESRHRKGKNKILFQEFSFQISSFLCLFFLCLLLFLLHFILKVFFLFLPSFVCLRFSSFLVPEDWMMMIFFPLFLPLGISILNCSRCFSFFDSFPFSRFSLFFLWFFLFSRFFLFFLWFFLFFWWFFVFLWFFLQFSFLQYQIRKDGWNGRRGRFSSLNHACNCVILMEFYHWIMDERSEGMEEEEWTMTRDAERWDGNESKKRSFCRYQEFRHKLFGLDLLEL